MADTLSWLQSLQPSAPEVKSRAQPAPSTSAPPVRTGGSTLSWLESLRPGTPAAKTPGAAPGSSIAWMQPLTLTPIKGSPGSSPNSYKDPAWDKAELAASQVTGVPAEVIRSIRMNGEKSNGDQVSSKGARGVYQFIESSRNAFKKKYGVDAYSEDPNEQSLAAAYHLKEGYGRTKDWARTVAGYNGGISGEKGTNTTDENINYVKRVMPSVNAATQKTSDATQYQDAWEHDNFAAAPADTDTNLAAIEPDDELNTQQA